MNDDITVIQRQSKGGAKECGWHLLSPGLLEKARSRVRLIAWLMAVMMSLGAVVDLLVIFLALGELSPLLVGSSLSVVVVTIALLWVAYSPKFDDVTVLHLALGYEVFACLAFSIIVPWYMYDLSGQLPYVTWVTPLIIMFPLIVPSPPSITLVTALLAASMRPVGLLLIDVFSSIDVDVGMYVMSSMSPAFAVVVAYAGSRVVHGMSVDLAKAQRMGSYQLETRLGSGGMGEVWLAKHQLLDRPAAVKLIKPDNLYQSADLQRVALGRFEREAQATAAMRSPHTIQLYDFGIAQSGAFYYVMEYLNGLDLDEMVQRHGPLTPSRLVYLLLQACDSLGEAHEQGLIHRDVKPANVYVCRHGRKDDFVKVLDFGLVKSERNGDDDDVDLTAEGTVSGTPAFVSPEQVLGERTDGRTDIYSLGCTAYWALTGSYVFQGKTAMATVMMHVNSQPSPPSSCGVQPIPSELDDIIMACLQKEPENRPQSADELTAMLSASGIGNAWTNDKARTWWEANAPT